MTLDRTGDLAEELRRLAEQVARDVGRSLAVARKHGAGTVATKSTTTDMVTEHDRRAERLIVEALRAARPRDAILGEEGTDTEGSSGVSWLVDPIDGTTNFLYDLPGWAVSVAAVDDAGALAGAVHVPSADELFSAHRGGGATLDGRTIHCSSTTEIAQALVATGFGYTPERRTIQAQRVARLIARVRDIRRFGAAAVDLCHVAAGRVDVYYEEHLNDWDLAAGELIAREAGCRSGDHQGGQPRADEVLVCPPALFEAMSALLTETGNHASQHG